MVTRERISAYLPGQNPLQDLTPVGGLTTAQIMSLNTSNINKLWLLLLSEGATDLLVRRVLATQVLTYLDAEGVPSTGPRRTQAQTALQFALGTATSAELQSAYLLVSEPYIRSVDQSEPTYAVARATCSDYVWHLAPSIFRKVCKNKPAESTFLSSFASLLGA